MAPIPPSTNTRNADGSRFPHEKLQNRAENTISDAKKLLSQSIAENKSSLGGSQFEALSFSTVIPARIPISDKLSSVGAEQPVQQRTTAEKSGQNDEAKGSFTLKTLSAFAGMVVEKLNGQVEHLPGAPRSGNADADNPIVQTNEDTLSSVKNDKSGKILRPGSHLNLRA